MHQDSTTECACGCGNPAKPGKRFIHGHNRRSLPHDPSIDGPPCPKCGTPKRAFNRNGVRDGQYVWCCPRCPFGSLRDWQERFPERYRLTKRAHWMIHEAVERGRLIRPSACEECGTAEVAIDAAHADYSKPLDVRWLCKPCHLAWDRAEPKTLIDAAPAEAP